MRDGEKRGPEQDAVLPDPNHKEEVTVTDTTIAAPAHAGNGKFTDAAEQRAQRLRQKMPRRNALVDMGFTLTGGASAPKADLPNTVKAIRALGTICQYNAFQDRMELSRGESGIHTIEESVGELSDHAYIVIRKEIVERFAFNPTRSDVEDACKWLCRNSSYNPVADYFDSLKWDRTERLGTWLIDYAGAEDTPLNKAIGRLSLIGMVRRVRQPGCKYDTITVLEGPEGTYKSSLLLALAGDPKWFSDQTILGLDDRSVQEKLAGKLVYEIADLAGMKKAEVEHIKAFASRTEDRARPAYGRTMKTQPRTCVLWATTNTDDYLRSTTGNRRFLPVATTMINLDGFKAAREQLLAEAACAEETGESIVLKEELWPEARVVVEARRNVDAWEDILSGVIGTVVTSTEHAPQRRVFARTLMGPAWLNIPADRQFDFRRLSAVMRKLGWEGPVDMRIDGEKRKGYRRPLEGGSSGDAP